MRLENHGREIKKGLLEGTKMWKYRNSMIAGVLAITVMVDVLVISYCNSHKEEMELKRRESDFQQKKQKEDLQIRMKYYEKILASGTDIPGR